MKRTQISLDKAKKIIMWEIGNANRNFDYEDPKKVQLAQDGMKVIWFDLDCYQKGQDKLIKLNSKQN